MEDVIIVHSFVEEHDISKCQDNLYSSLGKAFSTSVRDLDFSQKISDVLQQPIPKSMCFKENLEEGLH